MIKYLSPPIDDIFHRHGQRIWMLGSNVFPIFDKSIQKGATAFGFEILVAGCYDAGKSGRNGTITKRHLVNQVTFF
jgi:hypothetical protein